MTEKTELQKICNLSNHDSFIEQMSELTNDQLRVIYFNLHGAVDYYEQKFNDGEIAEYFRTQYEMIAAYVLFIRYDDDLDKFIDEFENGKNPFDR